MKLPSRPFPTRDIPSRIAAAMLLALALAACNNVTPENYARIKDGMTEAEVIAILGKPTETSSLSVLGMTGTSSTWAGGGHSIMIQFVDGKVRIMSLGKAPPG